MLLKGWSKNRPLGLSFKRESSSCSSFRSSHSFFLAALAAPPAALEGEGLSGSVGSGATLADVNAADFAKAVAKGNGCYARHRFAYADARRLQGPLNQCRTAYFQQCACMSTAGVCWGAQGEWELLGDPSGQVLYWEAGREPGRSWIPLGRLPFQMPCFQVRAWGFWGIFTPQFSPKMCGFDWWYGVGGQGLVFLIKQWF